MDNINKRCYRLKTIYNEKGLYDDFIDMSYVLLMENSKREKHVYEQINKATEGPRETFSSGPFRY